jgi:hypothetical protein
VTRRLAVVVAAVVLLVAAGGVVYSGRSEGPTGPVTYSD